MFFIDGLRTQVLLGVPHTSIVCALCSSTLLKSGFTVVQDTVLISGHHQSCHRKPAWWRVAYSYNNSTSKLAHGEPLGHRALGFSVLGQTSSWDFLQARGAHFVDHFSRNQVLSDSACKYQENVYFLSLVVQRRKGGQSSSCVWCVREKNFPFPPPPMKFFRPRTATVS